MAIRDVLFDVNSLSNDELDLILSVIYRCDVTLSRDDKIHNLNLTLDTYLSSADVSNYIIGRGEMVSQFFVGLPRPNPQIQPRNQKIINFNPDALPNFNLPPNKSQIQYQL